MSPRSTPLASSSSSDQRDNGGDNFELIDAVQWGPARDDPDYDTDQELAPRPTEVRPYACHCARGSTCLDPSCVLFACQEECFLKKTSSRRQRIENGENACGDFTPRCSAGPSCRNHRLQKQEFAAPVEAFDAGPKGRGLRVKEPVKKGGMVAEYVGRAITAKKLTHLFNRYKLDRRLYILGLGNGVYLDARKQGGIARFINHSCDPNCQMERWTVNGVLRAAVVALRDIDAMEELSFDYKWERKRGRAPTVCHCQSPNCRGTLEVSKSMEELGLMKELEGHWKKLEVADQTLINRAVRVFSNESNDFFIGEVSGYDPVSNKHCIFYHHDNAEAWEDLSKEKWDVLDDAGSSEKVIIAKKVLGKAKSSSSSLLSSSAGTRQKIIYVQQSVKAVFEKQGLFERLERKYGVRIVPSQESKPSSPAPVNERDEDVAKRQVSHKCTESVIWRISVIGCEVDKVDTVFDELTERATTVEQRSVLASVPQSGSPRTTAFSSERVATQLIFPRAIHDVFQQRLVNVREKCRNIQFHVLASESKSKQFSRISLEAQLQSDVDHAKEHVWNTVLLMCHELCVPCALHTNLPLHLGFLAGNLTQQQVRALTASSSARQVTSPSSKSPKASISAALEASEMIKSFERKNKCTVWMQDPEDRGRIDSSNQVVGLFDADTPRPVFIGCDPKDLQANFGRLICRANELQSGATKYWALGADKIFLPYLKRIGLFEAISRVTGSRVDIDQMTEDHLKFEGGKVDLALEIVRLQLEVNRDHCMRDASWVFGRDWKTMSSVHIVEATSGVNPGGLSTSSMGKAAMEIAETVAHLELSKSVGAHATIIMYRFLAVATSLTLKQKDAVPALVFIASKTQKKRRVRLEMVLSASFKTLYKSEFDNRGQEAKSIEASVIWAEQEILRALQYDVFWQDPTPVASEALFAFLPAKQVDDIVSLAFCGQVLSAGPELWLSYGADYVLVAAVGFHDVDLGKVLPYMPVNPVLIEKAAQLMVKLTNYKSASSNKFPTHRYVEGGNAKLSSRLGRIQEMCRQVLRVNDRTSTIAGSTFSSPTLQRYKIIAERSRQQRTLHGIPYDKIEKILSPCLSQMRSESGASIFVSEATVVLGGHWKAMDTAEYMIQGKLDGAGVCFQSRIVSDCDSSNGSNLPVKKHPGLLSTHDIDVSGGWEAPNAKLEALNGGNNINKRIGGKGSVPGTVGQLALSSNGLRWWSHPQLSKDGSLVEHMKHSQPGESLSKLSAIAGALAGLNDLRSLFPILSTFQSPSSVSSCSNSPTFVTIRRWPPERVEAKQEMGRGEKGRKAMSLGFSTPALQEMQMLTQLHSLVPYAQGHPNFVLPVAIAVPPREVNSRDATENSTSGQSPLISDTTIGREVFSLFRTSAANERASKHDQRVNKSPHIVTSPSIFSLSRLTSRKWYRSNDDDNIVSPLLLTSWCHDLLSILVHCHSNKVVLRSIQEDHLVLNAAGVIQLGNMYKSKKLDDKHRSWKDLFMEISKKTQEKELDESVGNVLEAPEILFGCTDVRPESDVWSLGCLMASMLLQKPLFSGCTRRALLGSIYRIAGHPRKAHKDKEESADNMDHFREATMFPRFSREGKKVYKPDVVKGLTKMLGERKATQYSKLICLISNMLHLDPRTRCTAEQALTHDSMVEYVDQFSNDPGFRKHYVRDWVRWKHRLMSSGNESEDAKKERKRKKREAMLTSASVGGNTDDNDLYNIDDIELNPIKKPKGESLT